MKQNIYPFVAEEIKRQLKTKAISYKQLGEYLCVSEKTITRSLNNHQELSLERLSSICMILNIQLSTLLSVAEKNMSKIHYFTEEQDKVMSTNIRLYQLLVEVYDEQNINILAANQGCTVAEMYLYLRELERVDLISIGTNNIITVNIPRHTVFHPNSLYAAKIRHATLNSLTRSCCHPDNKSASVKIVNVELSKEEYSVFLDDMSNYFLQLIRDLHRKSKGARQDYTIALLASEGQYYPYQIEEEFGSNSDSTK
ncbi:helix-turn-helix domain-containing protein [Vibrio porteresiae]|uniref:Helix-turn-helix transcriptional regulator n=1 Tax=Vibrio porteresiae DSM 19223 TaxID=1123496 RepID=A0ABZ0QG75_9VIBR|nr:helix-turn-helix transcriptional regulator [Vibrio porteresiae]WPC75478.1 helix-turn-helix transcriptional regulator [Vibrio porteresiae DSM 19223]